MNQESSDPGEAVRVSTVEGFHLELEAGLRSLETAFPPPDGQAFYRNCRKLVDSIDVDPDTLESILAEHSFQERLTKRSAILHVLASSLRPDKYPWDATLELCAINWPEWGYPYLAAARALDHDGIKDAHSLLEKANARLRVADDLLLATLEKVKQTDSADGDTSTQEFAYYWLSRHKCTASNFAAYVDFSTRTRRRSALKETVYRWLSLFGTNPDQWPIEDDFLDLSAAGTLCIQVNRVQATSEEPTPEEPHDFLFWNRKALEFFQRSLNAAERGPGGRGAYVPIRIAETYAQILRFPHKLTDSEFKELFEAAERTIVELTDRFKGQGRKDGLYQASRNLAGIYTGAVRRARLSGAEPAMVNSLIERADSAFQAWSSFSKPEKRELSEREREEFLYNNVDYQSAVEALARTELSTIGKIAIKFRSGKLKEAVKHALREMEQLLAQANGSQYQATKKRLYQERIGLGVLLSHYLNASMSGSSLPVSLRKMADDALRSMIPLFIAASKDALLHDRLDQARRLARAAERAQGGPSPNLLHLAARIELRVGKSPAEILAPLMETRGNLQLLGTDEYLRGIFLQVLARSDQFIIESDVAWSMVRKARHPRKILEGGNLDPISIVHVLQWELRSGQIKGWPERLLRAVLEFPEDAYFLRLPQQACAIAPQQAPDLLVDLIRHGLENHRLTEWCSRALEGVPSELFLDQRVLEQLGPMLQAHCIDISPDAPGAKLCHSLADGLSRALIASSLDDGQKGSSARTAAEWLSRWIPVPCLPACWSQLLGSHRGALEGVLVNRLRTRIDSLRDVFHHNTMPKTDWIQHLNTFIASSRALKKTGDVSVPGLPIVEHCVSAAANYRPWQRDSAYWPMLQGLVTSELGSLPPADQAARVANLWLRIHSEISRLLEQRLLPVMVARFHAFKNEIESSASDASGRWMERLNMITGRALEFLHLHRWPRLEPIDMRSVLCDAAYHPPFAAEVKAKPTVPRVWAVRPDTSVEVFGDHPLLVEVVTELLRNSLKANSSGRLGWLFAELSTSDTQAILTVSDDAGGCPPYTLEALNTPYEGHGPSGSEVTGFGHMFCQRIVRLHSGTLSYSLTDTGLRAELRLPLCTSSASRPE